LKLYFIEKKAEEALSKILSHQLRLARESLNLTRKDVAERWNITQQAISK
jgi:DNA-binding XRE family transcriptional regulator